MFDIPELQALIPIAVLVTVITRPPTQIFKYPTMGIRIIVPARDLCTRGYLQDSNNQSAKWHPVFLGLVLGYRQMPTMDTTLFWRQAQCNMGTEGHLTLIQVFMGSSSRNVKNNHTSRTSQNIYSRTLLGYYVLCSGTRMCVVLLYLYVHAHKSPTDLVKRQIPIH